MGTRQVVETSSISNSFLAKHYTRSITAPFLLCRPVSASSQRERESNEDHVDSWYRQRGATMCMVGFMERDEEQLLRGRKGVLPCCMVGVIERDEDQVIEELAAGCLSCARLG